MPAHPSSAALTSTHPRAHRPLSLAHPSTHPVLTLHTVSLLPHSPAWTALRRRSKNGTASRDRFGSSLCPYRPRGRCKYKYLGAHPPRAVMSSSLPFTPFLRQRLLIVYSHTGNTLLGLGGILGPSSTRRAPLRQRLTKCCSQRSAFGCQADREDKKGVIEMREERLI